MNITNLLMNRHVDVVDVHNYDELIDLALKNAQFFERDSTESGQRIYVAATDIRDSLGRLWPLILTVKEVQADYDFDENTPGNGYRSFVIVACAAIQHCITINNKVLMRRENTFFRKTPLSKEMESCAQLLSSLHVIFTHLVMFMTWSDPGELFPREKQPKEHILSICGEVDQRCYYGRNLGFQFSRSLRHIFQFISMSMAIFSEFYYEQGSLLSKATTSVVALSKYINDPERRAERIVNLTYNTDVDFCKTYWFLSESELMCTMPSVVAPTVAVSKVINIPPEPFTINVNGKEVPVPVPSSHVGARPIPVRLISYQVHEGMIGAEAFNKTKCLPPARGLLIHCHGGGFVAQSSLSHESYLREWATRLRVPILSIDYSLAPEAPFPRAIEEVVYASCWAVKNCRLLGSTGERVVAAGDSAGANLLLSTAIKCQHLDLPRPLGILIAYVPVWIDMIPSPARTLCLMDPLLPFGFLIKCLKAYASPPAPNTSPSNTESFEEISESDLDDLRAHKSPPSGSEDDTLSETGSLMSNEEEDEASSQKYVTDFLQKYVLDTETDSSGTSVPVLREETVTTNPQQFEFSIQKRLVHFVTGLKERIANLLVQRKPTTTTTIHNNNNNNNKLEPMKKIDLEKKCNFVEEFQFPVIDDPYLSPYCASDEDLKRLPPIRVLSAHLDPCLDDCVMFAKKLKRLENDVKLDILYGLPHGFLNFALISKEAYDGSKVCIERIRELFKFDSLPPLE